MAAHSDIRSITEITVDAYLPVIEGRLYQRKPIDSLELLALFAQPGAVAYAEKRLYLPITGNLNDMFDNYPYEHVTVDIDDYGDDRKNKVIFKDGIIKLVNPELFNTNNIDVIVETAIRGHFDILWHFHDFGIKKVHMLEFMAFGFAYRGQTIPEELYVAYEKLEKLRSRLDIIGLMGALCGGHIDILDHYADILGDQGPYIYETSGHHPIGFFTSNLATIKHLYSNPRYNIYVGPLAKTRFKRDLEIYILPQHGNLEMLTWAYENKLIELEDSNLWYNLAHFQIMEREFGKHVIAAHIPYLMRSAIRNNNKATILYCIENGYDNWNEAIITAAEEGNLELVKFFEQQGATQYEGAMFHSRSIPRVYNYFLSKGLSEPDEDHDLSVEFSQEDY